MQKALNPPKYIRARHREWRKFNCPNCGIEITTKSNVKKYCSKPCQARDYHVQSYSPVEFNFCLECGDHFMFEPGEKKHRRLCSLKCKKQRKSRLDKERYRTCRKSQGCYQK